MAEESKQPRVVAVSGGFDPVHIGHVRLFEDAKRLGDRLVVILNNDHWLRRKKGFVFMPQEERKELLLHIRSVDEVFISSHKQKDIDMSVARELRKIRPAVFANGGDRTKKNIPELEVCTEIGTKAVFNIGSGGKVQSSSWLLENYSGEMECLCGSGKKYRKCHGK